MNMDNQFTKIEFKLDKKESFDKFVFTDSLTSIQIDSINNKKIVVTDNYPSPF
jgi:hypothetical protein